jgi:hypothetical protein
MNRTSLACTSIASAAVLASATLLTAGPLNPPPGPVASTYKTLAEVEPRIAINAANTPGDADSIFRITQPGSYYLTQSYSLTSAQIDGHHFIKVDGAAAWPVVIDLGGFSVVVAGSPAAPLDGVNAVISGGLHVKNGTLVGFRSAVSGVAAGHTLIEDITATLTTGPGITVANHAILRGCHAQGCGATANAASIVLGPGSVAEACIVQNGYGSGFVVGDDSSLSRCVVRNNTVPVPAGSAGFALSNSTTVVGCVSRNSRTGFLALDTCSFSDCAAAGGDKGFAVRDACSLRGCTASGVTQDGFTTRYAGAFDNCTALGSGSDGFTLADGSVARGSTARSSVAFGFAPNFAAVIDSAASANASGVAGQNVNMISRVSAINNTTANITTLGGLVQGSLSTGNVAAASTGISSGEGMVQGCLASGVGPAGMIRSFNGLVMNNRAASIDVSGSYSFVHENRVTTLIANNTGFGSSNVLTSNHFGTLVQGGPTAAGAILDVTAGGTITTTNPWTNFRE